MGFFYQGQPAERADSRRSWQPFLRAAMPGWSGRGREASEVRRELQAEYPDFSPEAGDRVTLDALSSGDATKSAMARFASVSRHEARGAGISIGVSLTAANAEVAATRSNAVVR